MPLTKSVGHMYNWVTHVHTHLGGKCPHECSYCYVGKSRYGVIPRYQGELRLIEKEFQVNYGSGKTIFIEHMNDLFAEAVPREFITRMLGHCLRYPENTYVFQTKNPNRILEFIDLLPKKVMLGTTIETNREIMISKAPEPSERVHAMYLLQCFDHQFKLFVTIEPIMKFDLKDFLNDLRIINPDFINIGADSKHCNLPEPTPKEVQALIKAIQEAGLNIRVKHNLDRFIGR